MSDANKYESQYRQQRDCCGAPFPEIEAFFSECGKQEARILDLGCGQGRDALMAARHGHSVVGVDLSTTGIAQMMEDARREDLDVRGVVANLTEYEIDGDFDVIILDRILHMLEPAERTALLTQVVRHVAEEGLVLIADLPSHKASYQDVFNSDTRSWTTILNLKGFLFLRRVCSGNPSHPWQSRTA
ncbi:class I SAM-dependent methyltransferase [Candidatus Bipolaricaulota bacterium]